MKIGEHRLRIKSLPVSPINSRFFELLVRHSSQSGIPIHMIDDMLGHFVIAHLSRSADVASVDFGEDVDFVLVRFFTCFAIFIVPLEVPAHDLGKLP